MVINAEKETETTKEPTDLLVEASEETEKDLTNLKAEVAEVVEVEEVEAAEVVEMLVKVNQLQMCAVMKILEISTMKQTKPTTLNLKEILTVVVEIVVEESVAVVHARSDTTQQRRPCPPQFNTP